MRAILRRLHSVFGLAGAVWLFLLGLTGSLLVFYTELDHALNPELFRPRGSLAFVSVDDAMRTVEASAPSRRVDAFWRGPNDRDIWTFRVSPSPDDATLEVYLDPTTGQVTGERVWHALRLDRAHLMPIIYQLHYNLLMGTAGEWFIGLVGFLWLLDHFVSLVLSFPSASKWIQSFRIRFANSHKLTFDLHRSVGVWLFLVTLLIAITGTYMNWRPYGEALVGAFSERSPWPGTQEPELASPRVRPTLTMQDAIEAATRERFQGASYDAARGVYVVNAFDSDDLTPDYGQRMFVVDGDSGLVRSNTHIAEGTAADVIDAWLLPLHNGKVAGLGGRILIATSGLALCGFVVTGLMIWVRRRRAREEPLRRSLRAT
jgi:uncharacterized iron-regulated membrane protein